MNATEQFILAGKMQIVVGQALKRPATAKVALAWFYRVVGVAKKRGMISIGREAQTCIIRIEDQPQVMAHGCAADILELRPEQIVASAQNAPTNLGGSAMAETTKKSHTDTIKKFCKKYGITEKHISEDGKIDCSLDLRGTGITALPEGLTVGGSLDLRGTGITALPEGLTVGGYLDLEGTGITALPEGLTVGGYLHRDSTCKGEPSPLPENYIFTWRDGKYIMIDGVFSEVLGRRRHVYKTRRIGSKRIEFIVTDGSGRWAHGATIKEARADLIYKIGSRDTSKYKSMNVDSVLTHPEAIEAYRIITGACAVGTRGFVESITPKKKYTIGEIITLTKGRFGNLEFAKFFGQTA